MHQIKKNLIGNVLFLLTSVIVVLYYTPYLVNMLGSVAYGVVPLTLLVNQYITIFTGSLTSALSRFLGISIQRKNYNLAARYLSSAILMLVAVIIVAVPMIVVFVLNIDKVFNIPALIVVDTKYLFLFTLLSFFVSLFSSIFNISQYASNRLDILNYIRSSRNILKLVLTYIVFIIIRPSLVMLGLVNIIVELLILVASGHLFYRQTKGRVNISYSLFSKKLLLAMLSMMLWSVVHQFGDTFIYQMDVFFVNKYYGSVLSGIVGTFINLGSYVVMIVAVVSSLFGPYILLSYSKKKWKELVLLTLNTTSLVGVLTAVLVGVFSGFSEQFITLWIGNGFELHYVWLIVKLLWMPLYSAAGLFAYVYRAHNKVKLPALMTIILGVVNLLVQYYLYSNYSYLGEKVILYGLILSGCIAILQSYVLNALCFNYLHEGNLDKILIGFIKIVISTLIMFLIAKYISNIYVFSSIYMLILFMSGMALLFLVVVYFFALTEEQQKMVNRIIL